MAAINFPDSPTLNQEFSAGDRTWKWNGTVWVTVVSTNITPTPHAVSHQDGGTDELLLAQVQVSGLDTALAGKAATVHTHVKSDITDFAHTHNASQIITTVSDKSANYTLVAADENTYIRSTGAAITITVPDVLADGESVNFIQAGAGQITFAGSGITLNSVDAKLKTNKQYSAATVFKAGGSYYLVGDLAA